MDKRDFDCLIPKPEKSVCSEGFFPLSRLRTVFFPREAGDSFTILKRMARMLKFPLAEAGMESASLIFARAEDPMPDSAWKLVISPEKIHVTASDCRGFLYGAHALMQMVVAAVRAGQPREATLCCGTVEDSPRFAWRGFMLDSVRHFQTADTIKELLFLLATFRINSFHWHLTDDQAWRWETKLIPGLAGHGDNDDGFYTQSEIHEIVELAERLGIRIIPELDVPGHSRKLLSARPDLACDPAHPGSEICIGNPESTAFLKELIGEFMELFPHSRIIHLGGDEAATAAWETCPHCQNALHGQHLASFRQLENSFMNELTQFVLEKGRTPMMWGTCSGQQYDPRTIMQAWLDIREPIRLAQDGNKVVYSVHNSFYLDYPADLSEPHETWMFELSERGIYMADPYVIWADKVKDAILGTEACLWTEMVPEWRVMHKILSRIFAYSECAWSQVDRKAYDDFVRRRKLLESAGYVEILRKAFAGDFQAEF